MKTVKIKVSELMLKVVENRNNHKNTFEKALKGYRTEVIKELEISLEDARTGRKIKRYISLEEPINQTKDYDRVIEMLKMTTDEIVELTSQEFSQYVLDQWSWSEAVGMTNSRYI